MVKFVEGDHNYEIVVSKLLDICQSGEFDAGLQNFKDLPFKRADPDIAPGTSKPGRLKVWSNDGAVAWKSEL